MNESKRPIRLLTIGQVCIATGRSKSSIYDDVKQGLFPPPIKTGLRACRWISEEITATILLLNSGINLVDLKAAIALMALKRQETIPGLVFDVKPVTPKPAMTQFQKKSGISPHNSQS